MRKRIKRIALLVVFGMLMATIPILAAVSADDVDWYEAGTSSPPQDIDDDIYTYGKVGIGIANPSFELHVHDPTNQNSYLQFTHTGTGGTTQAYGLIIGLDNQERALIINREEKDMLFYTDDTLRMGLKSSGGLKIGGFNWVTSSMTGDLAVQDDVGIGTDDPDGRLDVRGGNAYFNKDKGDFDFNVRGQTDNNLFYVDASGNNIGIGDPSPDYKLEIKGSSNNGYFGVTSSADGDTFVIDSSGNVGIGTNTVAFELVIYDSTFPMMNLVNDASGQTTTDGFGIGLTNLQEGIIMNSENTDLYIGTNNQERVRIDNNGNVGIGVTDPSHKLQISDSDTTNNRAGLYVSQSGAVSGTGYGTYVTKTGGSTTNVAGYFSASGASTNYGLIVDGGGTQINGDLWVDTNTICVEAATNKVGIGESVPVSKLDIKGLGTTSSTSALDVTDSNGDSILFVRDDGRVGIGTTNPECELEVEGDLKVEHDLHVDDDARIDEILYFGDENGGAYDSYRFRRSGGKLYLEHFEWPGTWNVEDEWH